MGLHGQSSARIKEGLWLLAAVLAALPLVTDRVTGWFVRGATALAGFGG